MSQEKIFALLLELAFLALLGVGYYYFQKRRILKHAKNELVYAYEDFLYDLNCYLDENQDSNQKQEIEKFLTDTEELLSKNDITSLCKYLETHTFNAPNEQLAQTWKSIKEIIVLNSN